MPGSFAFQASYSGDGTYAGSTGPCEPLTVTNAEVAIIVPPPTGLPTTGSSPLKLALAGFTLVTLGATLVLMGPLLTGEGAAVFGLDDARLTMPAVAMSRGSRSGLEWGSYRDRCRWGVWHDDVITATFRIAGELEVRRLGFGAMRLTGSGVWGRPQTRSRRQVLRRAVELGVNLIDTADLPLLAAPPSLQPQLVGQRRGCLELLARGERSCGLMDTAEQGLVVPGDPGRRRQQYFLARTPTSTRVPGVLRSLIKDEVASSILASPTAHPRFRGTEPETGTALERRVDAPRELGGLRGASFAVRLLSALQATQRPFEAPCRPYRGEPHCRRGQCRQPWIVFGAVVGRRLVVEAPPCSPQPSDERQTPLRFIGRCIAPRSCCRLSSLCSAVRVQVRSSSVRKANVMISEASSSAPAAVDSSEAGCASIAARARRRHARLPNWYPRALRVTKKDSGRFDVTTVAQCAASIEQDPHVRAACVVRDRSIASR